MATCDICGATMEMDEATAYTIEELQEMIRRGFGPPDKIVRTAVAAGWTKEQVVARWQQELDARPQPYWMFCPSCTKRAAKYMPAEEAPAPPPEGEPAPAEAAASQAAAAPPSVVEPAEALPPEALLGMEGALPLAAGEELAPEPQLAGKRPRTGRFVFVGLLIGLLGGVAFSLLVLDRYLHPVQPTPVATAVAAPTLAPTPATRSFPTRMPATPRPTELLFPPTVIPVADLSGVALTLDDMPTGFRTMPDSRRETLGLTQEALAPAFVLAQGRLRQMDALDYRSTGEFVISFLVYPLTPEERAAFDSRLADADAGLAPLWAALSRSGWSAPDRVARLAPIGESGLWLTSVGSGDSEGLVLEVFAARRGPVLEFVLLGYVDSGDIELDPAEPIQLLDARLAARVPPPPGATPRPTTTPPPGLANVVVRKEDLPLGFTVMPESVLADFEGASGLPGEGAFSQSQTQNITALYDSTSETPLILLSWMDYPLTEMEAGLARKSFTYMSSSTGAELLGIAGNKWRSGRLLEGLEGIGDAAVGIAGVDATSRPYMQMEVVFFCRERALVTLVLAYQDGTDSRVDIAKIARLLDDRLKAVLGE